MQYQHRSITVKEKKAVRKVVSKISDDLHAGAKEYRADLASRVKARKVEYPVSGTTNELGTSPVGKRVPAQTEFAVHTPGKIKIKCMSPATMDGDNEKPARVDKR
jgi:hypothetical protein